MDIHKILLKYWGYSEFREKQEEIIQSILDGKDTLGLLPTGGGKSICFQVPAMAMDGICIVVSPLIALMRDQVENLNRRNIPALMLSSAMSYREMDITLDNAAYGKYKFLYLSPERLQTELFIERCKKMNVCLIAVDEAHCISQWGYDFRPSYLQISSLREIVPKVPVIALTASATEKVTDDIQKKLHFKRPNLIQKSFARENLAYVVLKEEDVYGRMIKILSSVPGSSIIYANSRKRTVEIAGFLRQNGISAEFYHAGLPHQQRNAKQKNWLSNKTRCMVATSAFGMGIDKPNVRTVIHANPTDSLEAYFQEAGRAGRDGKKAYAILLISPQMPKEMKKRFEQEYPPLKQLNLIYNALCNYFRIPIGGGENQSFDFPLQEVAERYKRQPIEIYTASKLLDKSGLISLSEAFYNPSVLKIVASSGDLYQFQVAHPKYDFFIKTILRSYSGIFDSYSKIAESELARRVNKSTKEAKEILNRLQELEILDYIPQSNQPKIVFLKPRAEKASAYFTKEIYQERKKNAQLKLNAVMDYMSSEIRCRSSILLNYFGEKNPKRCGICDTCLKIKNLELAEEEFAEIEKAVYEALSNGKQDLSTILRSVTTGKASKVGKVMEFLLDNGTIKTDGVQFFL